MENAVQTQPEQAKEWYTTAEFAAKIGINRRTLNLWLQRHPDFVAKHCKNRASIASVRPRYSIHWKAIVDYATYKNTFHGNQHVKKEMVSNPVENAKAVVSENALQNIERKQSQLSPIQALLQSVQMMAEMEQRVDAHESKLLQLEEKIEAATEVLTSPVPVTNGQRQFLNDRVRKYCIEHDLPFHVVWRQVHEHVGLAAVHKYELKHYQAALKYVEKMYIETGLIW